MRIVFLGTPEFAVTCLKALKDADKDIVAVITREDAKKDRGQKLQPPPVKVCAQEMGIPVYQFKSLSREGLDTLKELNPDLMITVAFGQILSKEVLDVPRLGTINVHASLLPHLRGAAPIERSIMLGDRETGVTTMLTDVGLDTGDMLLSEKTPIYDTETGSELRERLAVIGADVLLRTLDMLANGTLEREKQDDSKATYAPVIKKSEGLLDFSQDAKTLVNKIRALSGMFGAYMTILGRRIKVFSAEAYDAKGKAGEVLLADKKGLVIACADKAVKINELQPEGKKRMKAADMLMGFKIPAGTIANEEK